VSSFQPKQKQKERKKRKYSIDEKEKLAKLCMKYKEEYDNHERVEKYDSKKKKFTKSTMSSGYLSKAVSLNSYV